MRKEHIKYLLLSIIATFFLVQVSTYYITKHSEIHQYEKVLEEEKPFEKIINKYKQ